MIGQSKPASRFACGPGGAPACSGLLLWAALAGVSSQVCAQAAVLLPAGGDEGVASHRAEAQRALELALEAQGLRVVDHQEAVARARGGSGAYCDSVDCASFLLPASDAALAVAVWVWAAAAGDAAETVDVTLVDDAGRRYPGKAKVTRGGVAGAARRALLDARALQELGPGPWITVAARPAAARVLVDGDLVGTVPYRGTIAPGRHTVEVRSEGYRPHLQTVDVPNNAGRRVDVDVALRGEGAARAVAPAEPADTRVERPLLGPLLLGGFGLAVGVADIAFILDTGCERRASTGLCIEDRQLDDGVAIGLGAVSVGALFGATLWYIFGGEEVEDGACLVLQPGLASLYVEGTLP